MQVKGAFVVVVSVITVLPPIPGTKCEDPSMSMSSMSCEEENIYVSEWPIFSDLTILDLCSECNTLSYSLLYLITKYIW